MEPVLYILAFAGVSALLVRLAAALFRLLQRSGEVWVANTAARSREARGDLTGLGEASDMQSRARRSRRIAVATVVALLLLLLVPPFTPWTLEVYAACALLWLVTPRVRGGSSVEIRRMP